MINKDDYAERLKSMTIQLELNPEFVERLSAEAKARGIGLEEYAENLLREAIATRSGPQGTLTDPR